MMNSSNGVPRKHIDILTLFPEFFSGALQASIVGRAQESGAVSLSCVNFRPYSDDGRVDDRPYGGGPGMVLMAPPIIRAVRERRAARDGNARVVLLSAAGRPFTQEDAQRFSQVSHLILICGRYEGIDHRVTECVADETLSIGPYVLSGGEPAALVVIDAIVRLLPDVLGNPESLRTESFVEEGVTEHPHYTRPREFEGRAVPSVLLSGDHQAIKAWRQSHQRVR